MRAVLISIRPEWVARITSIKKTLEVRKNMPKLEQPFKCYIYETQGRTETPWIDEDGHTIFKGRGLVIGEFLCDTILPIQVECSSPVALEAGIEIPGTCLTDRQILEYLGNGKRGFAWHISKLEIYDAPKSLSEFRRICDKECNCDGCAKYWANGGDCGINSLQIKRPPQSWCYVEEQKNGIQ